MWCGGKPGRMNGCITGGVPGFDIVESILIMTSSISISKSSAFFDNFCKQLHILLISTLHYLLPVELKVSRSAWI